VLEQLDWCCRIGAVLGALEGGLRRPLSVFVNVEPSVAAAAQPPEARRALAAIDGRFGVVVEFTERALTEGPGAVIAKARELRARGWGIALDDVGADPHSLALMPFIEPDVIKLDLSLVRGRPSAHTAAVVSAVGAEAERSGAIVLAEGIETEAQLEIARALGADYGQGWLFGRPEPLPAVLPEQAPELRVRRAAGAPEIIATPFEVVTAERPTRRGPKSLLLAISRTLEAQAEAQNESTVILSTFQDDRHLTYATRLRYERLARSAAFVGALGQGLSTEPAPGVRGAGLLAGETLRGEWDVTVVGTHFAAAFVACDVGDDGPDMERRFDFVLTYDRDLAVAAARSLMSRVTRA